MKLFVLCLVLSLSGAIFAESAVDSQIKAALYEIERAEKQIVGVAPNQAAKLKRIYGMIESAGAQLQASPNQQDPSWISARDRLDALSKKMSALQAPPPPDPGLANQLSPVDLGLLGGIDRRTDGLIREISTFKAPDFVRLEAKLKSSIEHLKQQYRKLTNPEHPQAIAVAQKVLTVEKQIHDQIAQYNNQQAALGDVEGELAKIRERMNPKNRPWFGSPVPDAPFTRDKVEKYTTYMKSWKADAQRDFAYLQGIEGKTDKGDVSGLMYHVKGELRSIDRYNTEMARRMEQELAGVDQINTYIDKIPLNRMDAEINRLESAIELTGVMSHFNQAVGREAQPIDPRVTRYQTAIKTLQKNKVKAEVEAAKVAANMPKHTPHTTKKIYDKLTAQEIEIYGARIIRVTETGEVWIDGEKAGDITDDGEIWVAGDKEGDITVDGEVWKAGNKIGDVTSKGEIWREGNKIGSIESDGTIWINGSREGWYKGGIKIIAAAVIFYGFFNI